MGYLEALEDRCQVFSGKIKVKEDYFFDEEKKLMIVVVLMELVSEESWLQAGDGEV